MHGSSPQETPRPGRKQCWEARRFAFAVGAVLMLRPTVGVGYHSPYSPPGAAPARAKSQPVPLQPGAGTDEHWSSGLAEKLFPAGQMPSFWCSK